MNYYKQREIYRNGTSSPFNAVEMHLEIQTYLALEPWQTIGHFAQLS